MKKPIFPVLLGLTLVAVLSRPDTDSGPREPAGELLYNGIRLSSPWPPARADYSPEPVIPPYLVSPPALIPIDVGRQLFVDDFLIESTTLRRVFHLPEYYSGNPVLKPDKAWEWRGRGPMAMPFSDGVWFDPADRLFKMWYYGGHRGETTCYAFSGDGLRWTKPELEVVPGTNIVLNRMRDSSTVWLDHEAGSPGERFKLALYDAGRLVLFRSPDGLHWTRVTDADPPPGDRSTFFYNPFRRLWVYSLRANSAFGRSRLYWETPDFFGFRDDALKRRPPVPWAVADNADPRREELNLRPELYNLDGLAYESLILGFFSVWRGDYRAEPQTGKWRELRDLGRPKQNAVFIGYSRDGFHWSRPDRREFFPVSERAGDWNWGNVQSTNGCLVVGDRIYFYVSGRAGKSFPRCDFPDAGGSTGLATLRRDGFASMEAGPEEGSLTTRPVRFAGRFLFVNAACARGELRAEVIDEQGRVIPEFRKEACRVVSADSTRALIAWDTATDLSSLAGKTVRFRFHLRQGALYSFWVSPETSGASFGYVANGGPGFSGPRDTVGRGPADAP